MAKQNIAVKRYGRRAVVTLFDIMGTLIVSLVVFSILFTYFFRIVGVDGASMQPTLQDGDMLVLSVIDDDYRRGDIIVVERTFDEPLIKRVIAVGGETIRIDEDGNVFINDKLLSEDYIQGETVLRDFPGKITVPRGSLFVMGDNRTVSKDSRSDEVGFIPIDSVVGKATYCLWPMQSIGKV